MLRAIRRAGLSFALALALSWPAMSSAQVSITRSSSFAYDSATGLLTQEVVEPGTPTLRLQTDNGYDAFGNKVSVTVSGVDVTTRTATTTYDTRGQFPASSSNALGHSESGQYDPRWGKPTSHTGPNGLTTTWSYDGFGRKTLEVAPDGTRNSIAYQFCSGINGGSATCLTGAAYVIITTPYAADGVTQNGPILKVYLDRLDREVGRDTQGFNGAWVRAIKEYDAQGRVLRQSRPYFVSGGTPKWTTFTYDALDRVLTATTPDSGVTQTHYQGLVTIEINAKNQSRTVTKDARGQVVSVKDNLNGVMTYHYDPVGNPVRVTDAAGNVTSNTYDVRGRRTASDEPNLGIWTYSYNALGQVVSQTDAKGQTTIQTYDKLGRVVQRGDPDRTSTWTYDTAANGVGKLAAAGITAGADAGFQRSVSYDTLGRPIQIATAVGATVHTINAGYDANSRMTSAVYPSGLAVSYVYNSLGYAYQLRNSATNQVYWTANTVDAESHITQQAFGNGVVSNQGFDAATGQLLSAIAGPGGGSAVQNHSFTYDLIGSVTSRADGNVGVSETFTYDGLNRLTSAVLSTNIAPVKSFTYDAVGNLLSKSDIGTYAYPPPGSRRPHAVTSVSGSTISTTFTYDANGNQLSGLGRTIGYNSYNKPSSITQGTRTVSFAHDTEQQRFRQVAPEGTTLYFGGLSIYAELFTKTNGSSEWHDYLTVGSAKVGLRIDRSDETVSLRYFHTDHLGSISVISDENGAVVERLSYDAWGKRRYANGADDPTGSVISETTRGFTGHEHLDEVGLVHMNGRLYDPLIARMVTADPIVPDVMNPQSWNRYSYVGNDPLTFTDPTGHSWLSKAFKKIGSFFKKIGEFIKSIVNTIIRYVLNAMITAALFPFMGPAAAFVAAAATAAIMTGISGGKIGDMLRAATVAGITAVASFGVGQLTGHTPDFGTPNYFANVAGHAAVGCASSAASGGSCGEGAASGAVGAASAPLVNHIFPNFKTDSGHRLGGTVLTSVFGGLAAVAGGGKFENGAATAAFSYLYNNSFEDWRNCEGRGCGEGSGRAENADFVFDLLTLPVGVVRGLVARGVYVGIGATGKLGEEALKKLGGTSQFYMETSLGVRFIDQLVDGVAAHESKVGYASLTKFVRSQIAKDAELLGSGMLESSTWHFFRSPITGKVGPSGPLMKELHKNGISIVIHP